MQRKNDQKLIKELIEGYKAKYDEHKKMNEEWSNADIAWK